MSVQNSNPLHTLLSNPLIAGMIDNAAGTLVPVPQGAAQAAATATAATLGRTPINTGGMTKTATANLGGFLSAQGGDPANTAGPKGSTASQAGQAMGKLIGETVGSQGGSAVSQFVGGFVDGLAKGLEQSLGNFCPGEPSPEDKKPPSQPTQMQVGSDGVVHTPGGYSIEATSQYSGDHRPGRPVLRDLGRPARP